MEHASCRILSPMSQVLQTASDSVILALFIVNSSVLVNLAGSLKLYDLIIFLIIILPHFKVTKPIQNNEIFAFKILFHKDLSI